MARRVCIQAVVVCSLVLAACGGGGEASNGSTASTGAGGGTGIGMTSTSSGPPPVTADEACAAVAKATCQKLGGCSAFFVEATFGDAAACEARTAISCKAGLTASGAAETNPAKYKTCAEKLGAVSCPDILSRVLPAECLPDAGALADGKACGADAQCASSYCKKSASEGCGVCGARAAAGAACAVNENCATGLACGGGKCVAPGAEGGACSDTQPCGVLLYCNNNKCYQPAQVGHICTGTINSCDLVMGEVCNPLSLTCQTLKFAKAGEACGFVAGSLVVCSGGGKCNNGTQPKGTCVAPAADGAPCDATKSIGCTAPAVCAKNVCALPNAALCN
jgi:hypothetical protein